MFQTTNQLLYFFEVAAYLPSANGDLRERGSIKIFNLGMLTKSSDKKQMDHMISHAPDMAKLSKQEIIGFESLGLTTKNMYNFMI